jgi:molecular chaperone DnaK (HSP70)
MSTFQLKDGNKVCLVKSTYLFRKVTVYHTKGASEVSSVGFVAEEMNPPTLRCSLAVDSKNFPYITLSPQSNTVMTSKGTLSILQLGAKQRHQFQILLNTGNTDIKPMSLSLALPVMFALRERDEPENFLPLLKDGKEPFFLSYQVEIRPVQPYAGVVGIDFGTTSSCVSYLPANPRHLDPELIHMSGGSLTEIPTLLYFEEIGEKGKQEKISLISQLLHRHNLNPKSLVRGIKRHLGAAGQSNVHEIYTENGCYEYETEELVARYLDLLQKDFIDQIKSSFGFVGNTSPCNFGAREKQAIGKSYAALNPPVAEGHLDLSIDEPTAAAIFYTVKDIENSGGTLRGYVQKFGGEEVRRNLLVYDFGGGTIDIALVAIRASTDEMRFKILGNTSIMDFGGDNVTLALIKRMKAHLCQLLLAGHEVEEAHDSRRPGMACSPLWYNQFLQCKDRRQQLEQYLSHEKLDTTTLLSLERLIKTLIPTNFADFTEGTFEREDAHNLFFKLWDNCDSCKKEMCRKGRLEQISIYFHETLGELSRQLGLEESLSLLQERLDKLPLTLEQDLYPLIYKPLKQTIRAMRLVCMQDAQQGFHEVHEIRLAGNSSKIPLVKKLIVEEMQSPLTDDDGRTVQFIPDVEGVLRDVDDDAKTSVSKGMTLAMAIKQGAATVRLVIEDQSSFLPYEIGFRETVGPWHTIFARGDKLPPDKNPIYRPADIYAVQELELYRRICNWHKVPGQPGRAADEFEPPLYPIGKFVFSEEYANPARVAPVDHIAFSYTPGGEFSAQKMDRIYYFQWYRTTPCEADPFSGVH